MRGDPDSLPNMPRERWREQSPAVWELVKGMIRDGWYGRVHSYYESAAIREKRAKAIPEDWLTMECAAMCQELGVPIGRFFTAASIIEKDRS
jgi:hypothetical protein